MLKQILVSEALGEIRRTAFRDYVVWIYPLLSRDCFILTSLHPSCLS